MENPIKISQEELVEFNKLKEDIQQNTFELGVLYLEKLEIESLIKDMSNKESDLRSKIAEFKQRESNLMDKILQKYGEGRLDIKNGLFLPSKKSV